MFMENEIGSCIFFFFFEYDQGNENAETKVFFHSIPETIMWETNSNVFANDIITSTINKCNISRWKEVDLVLKL